MTELVYGSVRMRRACDWLVDRHLRRPVEPYIRAALRLGAYQLAPRDPLARRRLGHRGRGPGTRPGLVNAVLRRVAEDVSSGVSWPSEAAAQLPRLDRGPVSPGSGDRGRLMPSPS